MNDDVAGTPLASMIWQSDLGRIRFRFKPGTDVAEKKRFLKALLKSAEEELERWMM